MTQEDLENNNFDVDKTLTEIKRNEQSQLSKVVVRRLPPSLTPEEFLELVSPLPAYDFFYFVKADMSLGQNAFTRAYIHFQDPDYVFVFKDKFDGYVFVDGKGHDYPAVVEFATFQKVPKKKTRKSDSRKGTIEQDADYKLFLESLENPENDAVFSLDAYVEELEAKASQRKANSSMKIQTPLLEFLKKRRDERHSSYLLLKRNDRVQVASHVRQIGGSGGLRFSKENREREKAVREKITDFKQARALPPADKNRVAPAVDHPQVHPLRRASHGDRGKSVKSDCRYHMRAAGTPGGPGGFAKVRHNRFHKEEKTPVYRPLDKEHDRLDAKSDGKLIIHSSKQPSDRSSGIDGAGKIVDILPCNQEQRLGQRSGECGDEKRCTAVERHWIDEEDEVVKTSSPDADRVTAKQDQSRCTDGDDRKRKKFIDD